MDTYNDNLQFIRVKIGQHNMNPLYPNAGIEGALAKMALLYIALWLRVSKNDSLLGYIYFRYHTELNRIIHPRLT